MPRNYTGREERFWANICLVLAALIAAGALVAIAVGVFEIAGSMPPPPVPEPPMMPLGGEGNAVDAANDHLLA